jgi:steroid 5-alpha reductase family enzyme
MHSFRFPFKLAGFWATQGLWAWTVCLPVTVAHATMGAGAMGAVPWVGAAAWAVGFTWESVADYQKSAFKKDPSNKGK